MHLYDSSSGPGTVPSKQGILPVLTTAIVSQASMDNEIGSLLQRHGPFCLSRIFKAQRGTTFCGIERWYFVTTTSQPTKICRCSKPWHAHVKSVEYCLSLSLVHMDLNIMLACLTKADILGSSSCSSIDNFSAESKVFLHQGWVSAPSTEARLQPRPCKGPLSHCHDVMVWIKMFIVVHRFSPIQFLCLVNFEILKSIEIPAVQVCWSALATTGSVLPSRKPRWRSLERSCIVPSHGAPAWLSCKKCEQCHAKKRLFVSHIVTLCLFILVHIDSWFVWSSHHIPLWGIGKTWNKCCKRIPRIAVPSNGNSEGHLGCWRQVPSPKGSNLAVQIWFATKTIWFCQVLHGFTLACDIPHACSLVRGDYLSRNLSSPLLQPAVWQQDHPKSAHIAIWW